MNLPNVPPPQGKARLIESSSDPMRFTAEVRESPRAALTRGLAEYVEQLTFNAFGGRLMRFKRTLSAYPDTEVGPASFPACIVSTPGGGEYEARSLTPSVNPGLRLPAPDGRYIVATADYSHDVELELWATDNAERDALVQMLEQAFMPVLYRSGFALELPFYFNARAVYLLKSLQLTDSEDDAVKRYRKATFTLSAVLPLLRLVSLPDAKPLFQLASVGSESSVLLTLEVT